MRDPQRILLDLADRSTSLPAVCVWASRSYCKLLGHLHSLGSKKALLQDRNTDEKRPQILLKFYTMTICHMFLSLYDSVVAVVSGALLVQPEPSPRNLSL